MISPSNYSDAQRPILECGRLAGAGALALVFLLVTSTVTQAAIADLKTDYSETNNPNTNAAGTWRYNQGTSALSAVSSWFALPNERGWGPAANVAGNCLPAVIQAHDLTNLTVGNHNGMGDYAGAYQVGDVIIHSKDNFNGASNGELNITWTSAITSNVSISGNLWPTRFFTRENKYQLILNPTGANTVLASGFLPEDGTVSRSNPALISIPSLTLHPGDVLDLVVLRAGLTADPAGDFAGVNLTVNSVPEPASLGLLGFGGATLLYRRSRRKSA